jgi:hypothetical protein
VELYVARYLVILMFGRILFAVAFVHARYLYSNGHVDARGQPDLENPYIALLPCTGRRAKLVRIGQVN